MVLVVVDYQKDFVEGSLGFSHAANLEPGILSRVEQTLSAGGRVVFTLDTHGPDYLTSREGQYLPILHCQEGSPGWKLYGRLEKYMQTSHSQIFFLPKNSFGPQSYDFLAHPYPTHILIVGLITNICVITNAILLQTQYPNSKIIIESALCASPDPILHQKALDVMASLQMEII